jgi:hypothetical protein
LPQDCEIGCQQRRIEVDLPCIRMINKMRLYLSEQTGMKKLDAAVDATLTNPLYSHGCRHTTEQHDLAHQLHFQLQPASDLEQESSGGEVC